MAKTIKLSTELWKKIVKCAEVAGYSSPEEFVAHVLETQVAKVAEESESDADILKKLKGLGYID